MNDVEVRLAIFGWSGSGPKGKRRSIVVPDNLPDAVSRIHTWLIDRGFSNPYMLYFNDSFVPSLMRREGTVTIRDGDEFRIIPIVAGG